MNDQETLFGEDEEFHLDWQEWEGMPEFVQEDATPYATVVVQFENEEDMEAFAKLVDQPVKRHRQTRGIWFPKREIARFADKRWRAVT